MAVTNVEIFNEVPQAAHTASNNELPTLSVPNGCSKDGDKKRRLKSLMNGASAAVYPENTG